MRITQYSYLNVTINHHWVFLISTVCDPVEFVEMMRQKYIVSNIWEEFCGETSSVTIQLPESNKKCNNINYEAQICFICHIHNYTEYNQQWNVFSAFNPSKCTHTWSSGQPTLRFPGAVGGSVPRSRVSPQSWTIPAGAEIRTHNLRLHVQRSIRATTAHILLLKGVIGLKSNKLHLLIN